MCHDEYMSAYRYEKRMPVVVILPLIPTIFIGLGLALLIWVGWPILAFQFIYGNSMISPLSDEIVKPAVAQSDLTKASNWFGSSVQKVTAPVDIYSISIPKINIKKAYVKINNDDLSKSLIHYSDSEIPGRWGNAVIFGHSVLPQFFDQNNYLTIFSLLPNLKINDEIFVNFDGMSYRYLVTKKTVTEPEDVTGLEQRYDGAYLTLVTCVPPGTYFKRLWVTARLVNFDPAVKK